MSGYLGVVMQSFGASAPVIINIPQQATWQASPSWALGLVCTVSNGASMTYSVQVTADPKPSANGNWNNHDTIVNQTGSINGSIGYPVTGVRLNLTAYASGTVNLGVCQWP